MAFTSEILKERNAQIMRNNQCHLLNFRNIVNFEVNEDDIGALMSIPPMVLTIWDVRSCNMCKIGEIKDFEIREYYEKLCDNGILRDEHKIVIEKRLTHALGFPKVFKVEWIKIMWSCAHYMKVWI